MTFGDIYVLLGGEVEAGDKVTITIDDEGEMLYTKAISGGIEGFTFLDSGAEGEVVRISSANRSAERSADCLSKNL